MAASVRKSPQTPVDATITKSKVTPWGIVCCSHCWCGIKVQCDASVFGGRVCMRCSTCGETIDALVQRDAHARLFVSCATAAPAQQQRLMIYHEACNITTLIDIASARPGPYSIPCECGRYATGLVARRPSDGQWVAHYALDGMPWEFYHHHNSSIVRKQPDWPRQASVMLKCTAPKCGRAFTTPPVPFAFGGMLDVCCSACGTTAQHRIFRTRNGLHQQADCVLLSSRL